jgi:hypothetical protein
MKTCSIENCNNPIWSKGVCKNHMIKKSMNDGKTVRMSTISNKKTNSVQNNRHIQQREMFLDIWKKRAHKSEISGTYLGKEPMSTYFHHILPKEKYPEACLDEENIILLTLEEHSNVENDMYRYEEVNNRRNQLNLKYERT